ncbi:hypothetical protein HAL07_11720 [Helicobacter ailurogastricus]|uniref:Uncharacterized protein n=1 Tax=Helicobacter ailurogastricus TaxID=1578720 RepID=A0A0K2X3L3_9HELI|nr:hypothetical protein HAL011_14580 [Helicobacter ailurogastricus]CRF52707.1 hypothetical protein HAL07_11720 [Helicobacter ailurogastricus]
MVAKTLGAPLKIAPTYRGDKNSTAQRIGDLRGKKSGCFRLKKNKETSDVGYILSFAL